ncbi:type VI secretion system baseplate subunit TssK [Aliidiomarina soli]|uniref:Type VI secretion system baseplate subunit TssK n=1 Tax=Aliidiomarina soli TaxID=1928574 RepID=A0A432WJ02_9GAMM|nr:type VI secretion system baseplate subunit TssK [Aliidiomarina soli]RUO33738.1 type VI secretion system baseplate subunit TssK [Aliidiomarina soli]
MKVVEKIVWAEGVVLTQQHFQRWDSLQTATHAAWHSMLTAYPWGVDSIAWNTTALANQRLELTELKAAFPDGRLVHFQPSEATPVQMVIADEAADEQLVVYVAMADRDLVAGITGYQPPQGTVAWQAQYREVSDAYDDKRKEELLFAQPNLMLITEQELRNDLVALPVCCLRRQDDGRYALDESWQPSLIRLQKHTRSYEALKSLQQQLLHRVTQYQEKRGLLGDLSSFSSVELAGFMLQKDLAGYLSELSSLLGPAGGHPHDAFLLLNRMIAQLRLYAGAEGETHEYQHTDQINTLAGQLEEIDYLLANLTYEQDVQLRLALNEHGVLVTEDHNLGDFSSSDFYLALRQPGVTQELLDTFPDFCKVAVPSAMEELIGSALPGLTLRYCKRIPAKIRQKSGFEYFAIEKEGELWQQVEQERELAVFCTGEFSDASVELLAVDAG